MSLCGTKLVDAGNSKFRYIPMTAAHAIIGRLVDLAKICSGLREASIDGAYKNANALVKPGLFLLTSHGHKRHLAVFAPKPDLRLEERIAVRGSP